MGFDINKIQEYFLARSRAEFSKTGDNTKTAEQLAKEDFEQMPGKNFNLRAIFSIFDTNKDGKITREEFEKVSEDSYNSFISGLKTYNENNRPSSNSSIWSYAKMQNYLNDSVSPDEISEDEVLFDNVEEFYRGKTSDNNTKQIPKPDMKGTHGFPETFNLPDITQMSQDEIIAELESYNIKPEDSLYKQKGQLNDARRERAKYDIGSEKVDGHIGTFVQNKTGVCTVLAQIGAMNDDEIHELFIFDEGHDFENPMTDADGKTYWNIKFPIDDGNDITVKITQDEIDSGQIEVEEFGETLTLKEFPEGDGDITAICMAFVKRFGSGIVQTGEWAYITKNRFTKPDEPKYRDNQHLELITDYKSLEGAVIGSLNPDELSRKGIEVKPLIDEDLSWIPDENYRDVAKMENGYICVISENLKACVTRQGVFLSDGRKIEQHHAMEIRRYDEKTNELIISGNEYNNMTEIRMPVELLQFYETASLPGTPGVDETPDPGIVDHKIQVP